MYRVFAATGASLRHCVVEAKAGAGKTALLTAGAWVKQEPALFLCCVSADARSRRLVARGVAARLRRGH